METAETVDRGKDLFVESLGGATVRQLGREHGFSHTVAAREVRAGARRHLEDLAGKLLVARRTGERVELLLIPKTSGAPLTMACRYIEFVTRELEELTIRTELHFDIVEAGVRVSLTEIVKED